MGLYADRFQRIARQRTYQRAIRAHGLAAILEPYNAPHADHPGAAVQVCRHPRRSQVSRT